MIKRTPNGPVVFSSRHDPVPSQVFDYYWWFAAERQSIFYQRLSGDRGSWTQDSILSTFRFTNAYRASDRVSQYLIRHVIYSGAYSPIDVVFRVILFKLFNKIETWEMLTAEVGPITYSSYRFEIFDRILTKALSAGTRIYSSAYIMPSGGRKYPRKHRAHLRLLETMMSDRLTSKLSACTSMKQGFDLLRGYPMIGDFLAYQYVTDLNYTEVVDFSEMEFVVPGPGARSGLHKCFSDFGDWSEQDILRWVTEHQEQEFSKRQLEFKSLWGRPLQLIDCQNLFCEIDKYARVRFPEISGRLQRTRIKRRFQANSERIEYWYPPKWGINAKIKDDLHLARAASG